MRQECKKKDENGDLKAYEASQRPNNPSSNKIITKSQQFFFNKQDECWSHLPNIHTYLVNLALLNHYPKFN